MISSIFCLLSTRKRRKSTFLSDEKIKLYENAELLKFQNKSLGRDARLLLPGEAFLVSRALRREAATIHGRLQDALLVAIKVEKGSRDEVQTWNIYSVT